MAIYHFHAKMVQRKKGESTVAGAAYRSAIPNGSLESHHLT
jgi:hypothetical protein